MSLGFIFWLIMLLWVIFGIAPTWPADRAGWRPFGGSLMLFVLLFVIGWRVFGWPIQN